jgi:competence protein ComEC
VLNLLAAVAIAFLAVDPGQLFDASFQLSFLAVAALGAFTPEPWRGRIPDRRAESKRLERRLLAETVHYVTRVPLQAARGGVEAAARVLGGAWALFVMSAAVQAGLALPMALFFHRVSITGLTANVVVAPVVSQAIPFGFLAVFTGWQWPARAAAWLMDISQTVAAWHARYEPEWRIPDPPLWLAVAIPCAFVACAMARGGKWRLGWAAVCAGLLVLLVAHPFAPRTVAGELELSALDVGQGESLVVGLPNGELAAVDGGGLPQFGRRGGELFDIGEEVVSPYLWARGVKRLAAVAVTHLHDDHAGGIVALMENFRPREVWTAFTPENEAWLRIAEKARQRGIAVRVLHQGERFEFGGARWEVLAPVGGQNWKGKPRNNDSLVLRVRHGRHAFLLTGDIERGVEARLLEEGELEPVQVLKVAHHGSRLSTLPVLLDTLRPAVALISAGAGNMYGLPHPSVVEELRRRGMFVMRTDKDGLVTVRSDGRYLGVEPSRLARAQWSAWDLF